MNRLTQFTVLILLSMPISVLADGGPYSIMGCDTPVLDYVEPDTPSIVIADVMLSDGQSARLTLNVDKNEIAVATESSDTVALIKVDDESILRFMTMDPLADKSPSASPYAYCMGDPINYVDPVGCDTVRIDFAENKWTISEIKISEGPDVFILSDGKQSSIYRYTEGEHGNRVCALNLENAGEGSYTLGVYHVSGQSEGATGFYVTPGGAASNKKDSHKRIKDDIYPIVAPSPGVEWRTPGVGGKVWNRGIRFHYSTGEIPLKSTLGCFVLFTDYGIVNNSINVNPENSKEASINFNFALGASRKIEYDYKKGNRRTGAIFPGPINYQLILKTR